MPLDCRRVLGLALVLLAAVRLSACGGSSGASAPTVSIVAPAKKGKHFAHVVIIVQENRTFDNLFATYPGADGATTGKTFTGQTIPLKKMPLESVLSPDNSYQSWLIDYHSGQMNGFNLVPVKNEPGTYVYQYVDPAQIQPYWDLARQYVLADHMFQTQGSGSFTAHQDLIAGGTAINASESIIDFPSAEPWGCDAPVGTVTTLITIGGNYLPHEGPFPCLTYPTMRDLLDAQGLSWKYYAPVVNQSFGGDLWNAFDAIKAVRYGPEWQTNQSSPETTIFTDIQRNTLPAVSWVIPDYQNSDHPGNTSDTGPSWVAQLVNAIGDSPAWDTSAIVVVWDDWGGWYDHVPPPGHQKIGGLGFRVPCLIISPYARIGYISHTPYEFGSILKFIENNWSLPQLGTTDVRAADFTNDFFDFSAKPRPFKDITAQYSRAYFLHQRPSNKPVDTE
jgi:phospholipase C